MNAIMICLIILSVTGFYLAYKTYLKESSAFFPMILIACSSVITYVFGIIGLLAAGAWLVLISGIVLIPVSVIRIRKDPKKTVASLFDLSLLFILISCVWAFFITRNVGLSHPDDFSHWYRICKAMVADNSYPTNADVTFLTYPPGTATWIYLFTGAFGFSVSNCFWGQSIINIAACCSLFSIINEKTAKINKVILFLCISAASVLLCAIDVSTYSLLVDGLLGLFVLGISVYLFEHDFVFDKITVPVLIVLLTFLNMIKVSGLMFELFIIVLCLMFRKKKQMKTKVILPVLAFIIPAVLSILYRVRNSFLFSYINISSQAVSTERFLSNFSEKTPETLKDTVINLARVYFNPISEFSQIIIIWLSFVLLFVLLLVKRINKTLFKSEFDHKRLVIYLLLIYFIYYAGIVLTYTFSMNTDECQRLSCCFRYFGTIAVYIVGLCVYGLLRSLSGETSRSTGFAVAVYMLVNLLAGQLLFGFNYIYSGKQQYSLYELFIDDTAWNKLCEYSEERMDFSKETYLVIWDDAYLENSYYYAFQVTNLSRAFFRTNMVTSVRFSQLKEDPDFIEEHPADHVIIVGELL